MKFGACSEVEYLSILHKSWVGYICTCASLFKEYLGNGWMHCAEIWCVLMGPFTKNITHVVGYIFTCTRRTLFCVSGTTGRRKNSNLNTVLAPVW